MQDGLQDDTSPRGILGTPLLRLLAINLAAGAAAAVLLVGGLLLINPGDLRDLILADRAPGVALLLLTGSFVITFGSTAMGTAIMASGRREATDDAPRGPGRLVARDIKQPRGS